MDDIDPPNILNRQSVTIIRLGEDYANLYENMLEKLSFIDEFATSLTPPRLVIDMQHVKLVGSAFLGRMVTFHKLLTTRETGRFALCGLSPFCRTAVAATKLDGVFEIFENVDDAVQAFSADL